MTTRANIHLDTDAYDYASAYASAKGLRLGAALSELVRQAQQMQQGSGDSPSRIRKNEFGYYEVTGEGRLTSEMVKDLSEDEIG